MLVKITVDCAAHKRGRLAKHAGEYDIHVKLVLECGASVDECYERIEYGENYNIATLNAIRKIVGVVTKPDVQADTEWVQFVGSELVGKDVNGNGSDVVSALLRQIIAYHLQQMAPVMPAPLAASVDAMDIIEPEEPVPLGEPTSALREAMSIFKASSKADAAFDEDMAEKDFAVLETMARQYHEMRGEKLEYTTEYGSAAPASIPVTFTNEKMELAPLPVVATYAKELAPVAPMPLADLPVQVKWTDAGEAFQSGERWFDRLPKKGFSERAATLNARFATEIMERLEASDKGVFIGCDIFSSANETLKSQLAYLCKIAALGLMEDKTEMGLVVVIGCVFADRKSRQDFADIVRTNLLEPYIDAVKEARGTDAEDVITLIVQYAPTAGRGESFVGLEPMELTGHELPKTYCVTHT